MKNITFIKKYTDNTWDIWATADACNKRFYIGQVHEVGGPNPALDLNVPLGIKGVRQIIDLLESPNFVKFYENGDLTIPPDCDTIGKILTKGEQEK